MSKFSKFPYQVMRTVLLDWFNIGLTILFKINKHISLLIDLAKHKSRPPDNNTLTWLEPIIQMKTSTCSLTNLKKIVTLMSSKPDPPICLCDTGQLSSCFGRRNLNITWMFKLYQRCIL